ncbi:hypothetical protein [Parapedobacter sp. 10938]|uniref:hypothetical protein n=1 Tax=Parapedobacter flavus TaxID=3110225 RepID=UPI002DB7D144|nr:hypothetical protein [Parapedobacter sp. 10938]MEC3878660.1 hypothetical protein [Parapedobacter sp. 10938]
MTVAKSFHLIALALLLPVTIAVAQESRAERFERIEAEKIAFITKALNLTPSEAQKFFPVYNQYHKEIYKLKQERRSTRRLSGKSELKNNAIPGASFNRTDRDVLAFDAKELEVKKTYRKRFAAVVGQARASRFFEVEEEFRNYLLRELQERRRDRGRP